MKKILVFILCVAGMTASVMAQGNLGYAGRLSNHSYTGSVAGQVFSVNQPTSLAAAARVDNIWLSFITVPTSSWVKVSAQLSGQTYPIYSNTVTTSSLRLMGCGFWLDPKQGDYLTISTSYTNLMATTIDLAR